MYLNVVILPENSITKEETILDKNIILNDLLLYDFSHEIHTKLLLPLTLFCKISANMSL